MVNHKISIMTCIMRYAAIKVDSPIFVLSAITPAS